MTNDEAYQLLELIEDYGSEMRWVGHYREAGQKELEEATRTEASTIFANITCLIKETT